MRKPLALSAYLALHQSRTGPIRIFPQRPDGPLVWVHCADPERLPSVVALAEMLRADGDQVTILVTTRATGQADGLILEPIPDDSAPSANAFLKHWAPDVMIWFDGTLLPTLVAAAADRETTRIILDVTETSPAVPARGRVMGLGRAVLNLFDIGICASREGVLRLERAGLRASNIKQAEAFDPGPRVPPCDDDLRHEIAGALTSRPVWLVAAPPNAEIPQILSAYHLASQRAHLLLMILACDDPDSVAPLLDGSGLIVQRHVHGEMPDGPTQVLLADAADMGLWYRLAPLTYIGGTLRGGSHVDPFDAAAMGSVVIHGLRTDTYRHRFEQLADAEACRMIQTETELGQVIETLLAADKAATMAHAAWDVISRGAETGTLVAELVLTALDERGA